MIPAPQSLVPNRERGLALVGSLLLISMLAVMSTTFLLLMAADVRIAKRHFQNTQAYYLAESAAEIAALMISANPDTAFPADSTSAIIVDTLDAGWFDVYSYPYPPAPAAPDPLRRQLRIRAASGKAWYDLWVDVIVPTQDPRTYYPVVAGSRLRLKDTVQIVGGDGIWQNGSGSEDPEISDTVSFDSPAALGGRLYVSGEAIWETWGVHPDLDTVQNLEIESNHPTMTDIHPDILDSESSPYPYFITGDPTEYRAQVLPGPDFSGPVPAPAGNNPMAIYIWDYPLGVTGEFTGDLTFNGTIVCPGEGKLRFEDGNMVISALTTMTVPDQLYPAIVSRGEVEFRGTGTFQITGLVYAAIKFRSDPQDSLSVLGAVIASDLELKKSTTITYDTRLRTMPAAAFLSTAIHRYPTILFHQRRYLDLP